MALLGVGRLVRCLAFIFVESVTLLVVLRVTFLLLDGLALLLVQRVALCLVDGLALVLVPCLALILVDRAALLLVHGLALVLVEGLVDGLTLLVVHGTALIFVQSAAKQNKKLTKHSSEGNTFSTTAICQKIYFRNWNKIIEIIFFLMRLIIFPLPFWSTFTSTLRLNKYLFLTSFSNRIHDNSTEEYRILFEFFYIYTPPPEWN